MNRILANKIRQLIFDTYGFEVPTIVRGADVFKQLATSNPFLNRADTNQLFVTFLSKSPSAQNLERIKIFDVKPDEFIIVKNNIFGYSPGKYSDSKLTNNFFESKLKTVATTRNWKTVTKLLDLGMN